MFDRWRTSIQPFKVGVNFTINTSLLEAKSSKTMKIITITGVSEMNELINETGQYFILHMCLGSQNNIMVFLRS